MKTMTIKIMMAAAILTAATTAASAQAMKADIPFAFRAGNSVLPAGEYRIDVTGSHHVVKLSNYDAKQTAMLIPGAGETAPKAWRLKGEPVLAFECVSGRCALARLWTGEDSNALSIHHPKLEGNEQAMIMLIPLTKVSAD